MTNIARQPSAEDLNERLNTLRQRERSANEKLMRLKIELQNMRDALAKAKKEARGQFGTDDVSELREMYRKTLAENAAAVQSYEQGIGEVERIISEIESRLSASQGPAN